MRLSDRSPATEQDLIGAAHEAFTDAYLDAFPAGGDRDDHDEATRCGVEAVLAWQISEVTAWLREASDWKVGWYPREVAASFEARFGLADPCPPSQTRGTSTRAISTAALGLGLSGGAPHVAAELRTQHEGNR